MPSDAGPRAAADEAHRPESVRRLPMTGQIVEGARAEPEQTFKSSPPPLAIQPLEEKLPRRMISFLCPYNAQNEPRAAAS